MTLVVAVPLEEEKGEEKSMESSWRKREKSGNWCPPQVGWCARLTRTVKSPPAPFSTALAIRIERQCQGQGRPSPPCHRILSLSSLILLLSSCSVERTEHACVPPSFLRPALDRWEFGWRQPSKPRNANSSYLAIRISTGFFKFLESTRKNQRKIRFDSTCNRVSVERTRIWSINMGENAIFVYINPKQGFKTELGIKRILTYRCNITIFLFSRKSRLIKICNDTNLIYKYIRVI